MKVLRAVFLLLILANLLLFAYARGYLGRMGSGEPERLLAQLAPDKLRIVAAGEAPPAPATAPAQEAAGFCRELGPLSAEQALRVSELLRPQAERIRADQRIVETPASYWVFLPPHRNRQEAERRIAELKRQQINDVALIQEAGPNQWAVSLGIFKSEQSAADALEALRGKGLTGARMAGREMSAAQVLLQLTGPAPLVEQVMGQAAEALAGIRPGECAPGGKPSS